MSLSLPPVIVNEDVPQILDAGGSLVIICQESVSKKGTSVIGSVAQIA